MTDIPEKVERVARALFERDQAGSDYPDKWEWLTRDGPRAHDRQQWLDDARAAIDAHEAALAAAGLVIVPREPTEAMVRAFERLQTVSEIDGVSVPRMLDMEDVWPAMVAAALDGQP